MRPWYLEDRARHYRQNLLLSSFACAELNAIFHRHCRSHAGKARLHMDPPGVLCKLAASVQQASSLPPSSPSINSPELLLFSNPLDESRRPCSQKGIAVRSHLMYDYRGTISFPIC